MWVCEFVVLKNLLPLHHLTALFICVQCHTLVTTETSWRRTLHAGGLISMMTAWLLMGTAPHWSVMKPLSRMTNGGKKKFVSLWLKKNLLSNFIALIIYFLFVQLLGKLMLHQVGVQWGGIRFDSMFVQICTFAYILKLKMFHLYIHIYSNSPFLTDNLKVQVSQCLYFNLNFSDK